MKFDWEAWRSDTVICGAVRRSEGVEDGEGIGSGVEKLR